MALTVEDGSGKTDAESYISVADATTYHDDRGNTAWSDLDLDVQEQCLRKATEFMEAVWGRRWAGYRANDDQALGWPRSDVEVDGVDVADDAVPVGIERACAELALLASSATLEFDSGRLTKREKVGPIEVEYAIGSSATTAYRVADYLVAPYLTATGSTIRVVARA